MGGLLILSAAAAAAMLLRSTTPLVAYVMALLAVAAWRHRRGRHLQLYRQITPSILACNALVLIVIGASIIGLYSLHNPILNFSWYGLLLQRARASHSGGILLAGEQGGLDSPATVGNLLLSPLDHIWLVIPFVLLLLFLLPLLAAIEERMFRLGTRNWLDGTVRSVGFGLVHVTMGIPVGSALALGIGGLWLTRQYFLGGTQRSTIHHLAYNLLALIVVLVLLVVPI